MNYDSLRDSASNFALKKSHSQNTNGIASNNFPKATSTIFDDENHNFASVEV